ncbi:hypothetical protein MAQ58_23225, partial [Enterobacter sp. DRP3]|nr:hypothetical protein [Enterobacter sp. DRP3]
TSPDLPFTRTNPELHIEHEAFPDFDSVGQIGAQPYQAFDGVQGMRSSTTATTGGFQTIMARAKEDSDWFTDLNLEDLQSSGATPGIDMSNQDYYFSTIGSPYLKPSQTNMP